LETRQREFEAQIANPDFYHQDQDRIQLTLKELADNQAKLEQAYRRWEELEC
jgi:ATP-binding cassette subfamily F protein uup